ncbi:YmfQ family protein [Candidatus Erwinia dacicola]|uniref:Phage tail protein n=3 Tax=Candidatus Erwinia dacicola TaxID=252393 RepID=A0A1E7Z319_9GAMM|nr:putative phage tail protein [Candidatus Erwinia dacicola]OFC63180.1 phage tail protein [Candidatus Erwinia dacicola]
MTRNDWRELLYLLPDGYARDGKRLNAELQAEGNMLASVERSAQDVLNGVTPFTAVALLSYWERVLGLSVSNGMTIQARRQQIMAKLVETGGLSRSYFIRLAKSLGYDVTIDEPEPFRCGRNRCGDRLWIPEIVWVWIVNIQDGQVPVYRFRCGSSATGERLMSFGQNMLESIFRDLKPAHTQVVFNYVENKT